MNKRRRTWPLMLASLKSYFIRQGIKRCEINDRHLRYFHPATIDFIRLHYLLRSIGLLCLEAWLSLQDVPLAERHPSLGRGVYTQLLQIVLQQVGNQRYI